MNALLIDPKCESLEYQYYQDGNPQPAMGGKGLPYRGPQVAMNAVASILSVLEGLSDEVNAIGVRMAFGGSLFGTSEIYSDSTHRMLTSIIPNSPVQIPAVLMLIQSLKRHLPDIPIVLVFETGFFRSLPERESLYALDPGLAKNEGFRRTGFHGLFHEAGVRHVHDSISTRQSSICTKPLRILSICLEPRPEISAVVGRRPITVTSGSTPLEGLPGETICGEIDAGIILTLVEKSGVGPEQINNILTKESGVAGFGSSQKTLAEVLQNPDTRHTLVRDIIEYKMLQSCGAGIAAMSGVDAVVFSGRYAALGQVIETYLRENLFCRSTSDDLPTFLICSETLGKILLQKTTFEWLNMDSRVAV